MYLDIVTPDKKVFEGDVSSVIMPGSDGQFEVLDNHASLIASLASGEVKIKTNGQNLVFQIDGGMVEVLDNKVAILAEAVLNQ